MPGHNNSGSTSYSYPAGDFWRLATKTDISTSIALGYSSVYFAYFGKITDKWKARRNVQTAHFLNIL